jgi:hypothetical protein
LGTETIVPAHGSIGSKTILEMCAELKDVFNFDGVDELDSDEVEDAHASLSSVSNYHVDEEEVRFPLYPSSELDALRKTKWEEFMDIDFKDGAAFLHEPELKTKYVPGLLSLFGALTSFQPGKEIGWKNQKSLYATLPSIIIHFAADCRIDSGYRLLMRKHRISSSQYCHRITHPNHCFSTAIIAMQCRILAKVNIRTERSKVRQRQQWLLETFSSHLIRAALLASWTSLGDMQYDRVWTCSDAYCLPCILIEGFRCVPNDDIGTESAHGKLFVTLLLRWRHV